MTQRIVYWTSGFERSAMWVIKNIQNMHFIRREDFTIGPLFFPFILHSKHTHSDFFCSGMTFLLPYLVLPLCSILWIFRKLEVVSYFVEGDIDKASLDQNGLHSETLPLSSASGHHCYPHSSKQNCTVLLTPPANPLFGFSYFSSNLHFDCTEAWQRKNTYKW